MNSVEYNESVSKKWFDERKLQRHIKPAHEQVDTFPFQSNMLHQHGYNPSIVRFEKRIFMAYRYHIGANQCALAITEFDNAFNVIVSKGVKLDGALNEDPRLFVHDGKLCIVWVAVTSSPCAIITSVKYGELIEGAAWKATVWAVENIQQPEYGHNDCTGIEKNWVPFSHGGELHFIYEHGTVIKKVGDKWAPSSSSGPSLWRYGLIKGGTSPLPYKGKWLRFAHSTLDNEPPPWRRRYYILAVVMEPEPPFTVIQLSKEPILRGAETGRVRQEECGHFKALVVFPGGAIPYQDGWVLSVGVNDAEAVLCNIREEDLKL